MKRMRSSGIILMLFVVKCVKIFINNGYKVVNIKV